MWDVLSHYCSLFTHGKNIIMLSWNYFDLTYYSSIESCKPMAISVSTFSKSRCRYSLVELLGKWALTTKTIPSLITSIRQTNSMLYQLTVMFIIFSQFAPWKFRPILFRYLYNHVARVQATSIKKVSLNAHIRDYAMVNSDWIRFNHLCIGSLCDHCLKFYWILRSNRMDWDDAFTYNSFC